MVKGLMGKTCKKQRRSLGLFSMKRRLRGVLMAVLTFLTEEQQNWRC